MEQRSRRKRRSAPDAAASTLGRASARPVEASAPPADAEPPRGSSDYYARQRARDEAARAAIVPLAPGERPRAVAIGAVLAVVVALANVVLLLAGWEVDGERPQAVGTLGFSALMIVGAVFMWRGRYWAVLGFQALLAITILFAFLALMTASNLQAVVLCVVIMGLCGPLFWHLVKAMARLQVPRRPTR